LFYNFYLFPFKTLTTVENINKEKRHDNMNKELFGLSNVRKKQLR